MKSQIKVLVFPLVVAMLATLFSGCSKNPGGSESSSSLRPGFPDYISSNQNESFEYDVYKTYIAITKYIGKEADVVIPSEIENLPVSSIEGRAFSNDSDENIIHSISLPSTITELDTQTFYNSLYLEKIEIDASNTNFISEDGVLYSTDKKEIWGYPENRADEEYVVPEGVTEIKNSQFAFIRNLKKITLPSTLLVISDFSFHGTAFLEEVVIPEGTTTVGACAFFSCKGLKSVTFPSTITEISANAFVGCSNLSVLKGYAGTVVSEFAETNEFTYEEIG